MDDLKPLTDGENIQFANMLNALKGRVQMSCDYTNWRGEKSRRSFEVIEFWHGKPNWHPEPGLMLKAIDLDKGQERDFCVKDFDTSTLALKEPSE